MYNNDACCYINTYVKKKTYMSVQFCGLSVQLYVRFVYFYDFSIDIFVCQTLYNILTLYSKVYINFIYFGGIINM